MADYSTTYAIDNSKEYDVICHIDGVCRILVQENYNSANPPTDDLLQRCSVGGSTQIRIAKGTAAVFTTITGYRNGEKAGTIEAANGSITVQQIESSRV